MKISLRIKRTNEARVRRYQALRARIKRTNNTGLDDDTVLAILEAKYGPWSTAISVEGLLANLGIE